MQGRGTSNLLQTITPTQLLHSKDKVGEQLRDKQRGLCLTKYFCQQSQFGMTHYILCRSVQMAMSYQTPCCIKPKQDVTSHSLSHTFISSQDMMV